MPKRGRPLLSSNWIRSPFGERSHIGVPSFRILLSALDHIYMPTRVRSIGSFCLAEGHRQPHISRIHCRIGPTWAWATQLLQLDCCALTLSSLCSFEIREETPPSPSLGFPICFVDFPVLDETSGFRSGDLGISLRSTRSLNSPLTYPTSSTDSLSLLVFSSRSLQDQGKAAILVRPPRFLACTSLQGFCPSSCDLSLGNHPPPVFDHQVGDSWGSHNPDAPPSLRPLSLDLIPPPGFPPQGSLSMRRVVDFPSLLFLL